MKKNRIFSRVLSGVLAGALALSLSACGSSSTASSDASVMLEGQRQTAALQVASIDTSKALTPNIMIIP